MLRRYLSFIAILLFAFAIRMWDIDARSLWFDEAIEYWVATSNVPDLLKNAWKGLNDPPLYVFLLHWWMKIGQAEFFLRFPSVCFSVLSVAGVSVLTSKLFGQRAGLVAATVMTILPSEIRYAQEVGEYALMICGITFYLYSWQRTLEEHSFRVYAWWVIASLVATYSYFYAVFPIFASLAVIVICDCCHKKLAKIFERFVGLSLYAIGIVLLLSMFSIQPKFDFKNPSISLTREILGIELGNLTSGTIKNLIGFQLASWPWTQVPEPILVLLIVTLALLVLVNLSSYPKRWLALVLFTWVIYFLFGRARTFGFRYGLILTPLLIPTIAQSVSKLFDQGFRLVGIFACTGVLLVGIISLPNRTFRDMVYAGSDFPWPEIQDMRRVVKLWCEYRTGEQVTYVYYGAVPAFRYYFKQCESDRDNPLPMWYAHCWKQDSPDYCKADNVFYGAWIRNYSPEAKLDSIHKTLGAQPRELWIVFSHVYPGERETILQDLSEQYRVIQSYQQKGAWAYLLAWRGNLEEMP